MRIVTYGNEKSEKFVVVYQFNRKKALMALYNRKTKELKIGQWLFGVKIKFDYCACNDDASLFSYCAKTRSDVPTGYIVICTPPYFTAHRFKTAVTAWDWESYFPNGIFKLPDEEVDFIKSKMETLEFRNVPPPDGYQKYSETRIDRYIQEYKEIVRDVLFFKKIVSISFSSDEIKNMIRHKLRTIEF